MGNQERSEFGTARYLIVREWDQKQRTRPREQWEQKWTKKTKKDPLEISKNLRKTKHKNLSDTSRNSRMKVTDKELPRRREKGEDFVKEDFFFWVEWKWKKRTAADGYAFVFLSIYFYPKIKLLELSYIIFEN